jgi:hypothetical protein
MVWNKIIAAEIEAAADEPMPTPTEARQMLPNWREGGEDRGVERWKRSHGERGGAGRTLEKIVRIQSR